MDTFDMFTDRGETYWGSLWLYNSTQGVCCPGAHHNTIDAAEAALAAYAGEDLVFFREVIDDGIGVYAAKAYEHRINVAVILRSETGDVVSRAPLPDGWLPPGDPRR